MIVRGRWWPWLALGLSLTPVLGWGQPSAGGPGEVAGGEERRIVREGIAVEFAMQPLAPVPGQVGFQEGDPTSFRFQITDTTSATPLSGVFPAAWMDFRPLGDKPTDAATCKEKVAAFVGGSLLAPPELDLNTYYVLALNNDATISVVDPLFGYGTTKLLAMLFLESRGEDWALTPDQMTLFVSMPEADRVAVAETSRWKVLDNLDVCPRPSRTVLQPDARYLWVGCDASRNEGEPSGVAVIDARRRSLVAEIPTGRGHHEIAFSPDDRFAFVTNGQDGTLSVVDIRSLEKVRDVKVGDTPVSIAYSPVSQAVYVAGVGGTVLVVDGESHRETARLELGSGLTQIRFDPTGRYGFVVNAERDSLEILDASVNRVIQSADMQKGPDQIAFSDELAYVRHRDSELVLMVPLDQVGKEGAPVPVIDFPGGQTPFGKGSKPSLSDSIVQAPGANAVLVANPVDRVIYYYREGMAAPMGQFQNYGRQPRAVLAVDRSLREKSPGSYETTASLRQPGLYDVVFFLDSPRIIHCFPVRVDPNPKLTADRARKKGLQITPLVDRRVFQVGEQANLTFKLTDPVTGEPKSDLPDVNVLTFRAPGFEQKRQWAINRGGGVYEAPFIGENAGVYFVFLACPSLGLDYNKSPFVTLRVDGKSTAKVPEASQEQLGGRR